MSQGDLTINNFMWKVLKAVFLNFDNSFISLFNPDDFSEIVQELIIDV
jgi:hypothetical protein